MTDAAGSEEVDLMMMMIMNSMQRIDMKAEEIDMALEEEDDKIVKMEKKIAQKRYKKR